MERLVAYLIELYGGAFPTWLSPVQAVVVSIADRHISYAENVNDIRNSRSLDMVNAIKKISKKLTIYDPVVDFVNMPKIKILKKVKSFSHYDLIILNVKHKEFEKIKFSKIKRNHCSIVDTNNVLNDNQIKEILKKKIDLKIFGRGDL